MKKLDRLYAQVKKLREEIYRIEGEAEKKKNEKLVGTFWRYMNSNSDSGTWPLYIAFVRDGDGYACIEFQKDCYGAVSIKKSCAWYMGEKHAKITRKEFLAAVDAIKDTINDLLIMV